MKIHHVVVNFQDKILWIRGGFPRSFIASSEEESREWRQDFIRTFLEVAQGLRARFGRAALTAEQHVFVIHAGAASVPLTPKISAVALSRLTEDLRLD